MSTGLYTHTTRATGTILTAAIYNADHQNHVTNQTPQMTGAASDNVAQMQVMEDPGGVGTESLAGSLYNEITRLRFMLDQVIGKTHWYQVPAITLEALSGAAGLMLGNVVTQFALQADISPAQLVASVNDYAPAGHAAATTFRLDLSANWSITGLAGGADGRVVTLRNISSKVLTLPPNNAGSIAANRFDFPRQVQLLPKQAITLQYDATVSLWKSLQPLTYQQIAGGHKNLKLSCASNTQVVITADAITLEDANGESVRVQNVNVTVDITSGVAANGLDAGVEAASTWYFIHLQYNPVTNTVSGLLSLSATAPTLTAASTFSSRVGAVRNDAGSNFIPFIQYDRRVQVIMNGTALPSIDSNPGNSTQPKVAAIGAFVPSTASTIRILAHANTDAIFIAPNTNYDFTGASNTKQAPYFYDTTTSGYTPGGFVCEFILEGTNIYWWGSNNANSRIHIFGWDDTI